MAARVPLPSPASVPIITIVTVTRNAQHVLPALVEDMRARPAGAVDWVVIDGASTDGTLEIIANARDAIADLVSGPDAGIFDAMNKGLARARGRYVLFAGADDRIHPAGLAAMTIWLASANPPPDFVVAATDTIDGRRRGLHPGWHRVSLQRCVTHHSVGMLVRADVMRALGGFDPRFPRTADARVIKHLITGPYVGQASDIVLGRFAPGGASSRDPVRGLREMYDVQVDAGESRLVQAILYGAKRVLLAGRTALRRRP